MTTARSSLPIPPLKLASRIGGAYEDYRSIGTQQRAFIETMLPEGWSYEGKAVLDFGCGTGRTLSAFAPETDGATFMGCDIHADSIAWAQAKLSPPFGFFLCGETPPLDQEAGRFDLVYAMSVFTHITADWSRWLVELHRVMRPGGIAVVSVLGPAMARQILDAEWDERIGMAIVDMHKDWSVGGPDVLLSEWWVREHWGRAFEVLRFQVCDPASGAGHDLVTLRRRDVEVSARDLARRDYSDTREQVALECNLELLLRQQQTLGDELRRLQQGLKPASKRVQSFSGDTSRGLPASGRADSRWLSKLRSYRR